MGTTTANFVDNRVLNAVAPQGTTQFDDRGTSMAPISSDALTVVMPQGTTQVEVPELSPPTTTTTTFLHAPNAADSSNPIKADHLNGEPTSQAPTVAEANADATLRTPNVASK